MTSVISTDKSPQTNSERSTQAMAASSRPIFKPGGNWAALQQSIVPESSKKRKRESGKKETSPKLLKSKGAEAKRVVAEQVQKKKPKPGFTKYNPWRPNESPISRGNGNPALVESSKDGEVGSKYCPPIAC